jgi:hypothetical protein
VTESGVVQFNKRAKGMDRLGSDSGIPVGVLTGAMLGAPPVNVPLPTSRAPARTRAPDRNDLIHGASDGGAPSGVGGVADSGSGAPAGFSRFAAARSAFLRCRWSFRISRSRLCIEGRDLFDTLPPFFAVRSTRLANIHVTGSSLEGNAIAAGLDRAGSRRACLSNAGIVP